MKIIRKLLCWLGWHEWYYPCINCQGVCGKCKFDELELTDKVCWHCGKVKR
jgi:hypothetical protein